MSDSNLNLFQNSKALSERRNGYHSGHDDKGSSKLNHLDTASGTPNTENNLKMIQSLDSKKSTSSLLKSLSN